MNNRKLKKWVMGKGRIVAISLVAKTSRSYLHSNIYVQSDKKIKNKNTD